MEAKPMPANRLRRAFLRTLIIMPVVLVVLPVAVAVFVEQPTAMPVIPADIFLHGVAVYSLDGESLETLMAGVSPSDHKLDDFIRLSEAPDCGLLTMTLGTLGRILPRKLTSYAAAVGGSCGGCFFDYQWLECYHVYPCDQFYYQWHYSTGSCSDCGNGYYFSMMPNCDPWQLCSFASTEVGCYQPEYCNCEYCD